MMLAPRLTRPSAGLAMRFCRSFSTAPVLRRIDKICQNATEAIKNVENGSIVLVGGFGFSGVPSTLIDAVAKRESLKGLTVVSNNAGMPGVGLGASSLSSGGALASSVSKALTESRLR